MLKNYFSRIYIYIPMYKSKLEAQLCLRFDLSIMYHIMVDHSSFLIHSVLWNAFPLDIRTATSRFVFMWKLQLFFKLIAWSYLDISLPWFSIVCYMAIVCMYICKVYFWAQFDAFTVFSTSFNTLWNRVINNNIYL